MKIVFIGAPGCGKSTLAAQVFAALKQSGRSVELVPEWIRGEIAARGPMQSIWEQYRTRQYQREAEDAVPSDVNYVVCDSGTVSPYFYACLYADANDARQRIVLQDMYKYLIDDLFLARYDMIFYLPPIPAATIEDGIRYQSDRELEILDQHIKMVFTKVHRLPQVHEVSSSADQRLEEVMWRILGVGDPELSGDDLRAEVLSLIST